LFCLDGDTVLAAGIREISLPLFKYKSRAKLAEKI